MSRLLRLFRPTPSCWAVVVLSYEYSVPHTWRLFVLDCRFMVWGAQVTTLLRATCLCQINYTNLQVASLPTRGVIRGSILVTRPIRTNYMPWRIAKTVNLYRHSIPPVPCLFPNPPGWLYSFYSWVASLRSHMEQQGLTSILRCKRQIRTPPGPPVLHCFVSISKYKPPTRTSLHSGKLVHHSISPLLTIDFLTRFLLFLRISLQDF